MSSHPPELLKFVVCGSVDDGKSTLIGRLLYDTKSLLDDQLAALGQEDEIELAHLTDGLRAEREQGITIDVAYRYFATRRRRFRIADCPGHVEYTRNMVTGASDADTAVILINAENGVLEQTRRHAFIASTLGIRQLVVCINKMDLVNFSHDVFARTCRDFDAMARLLGLEAIHYIPICARDGDNVVESSPRLRWYSGPSLLQILESLPIGQDSPRGLAGVLPVQWVIVESGAKSARGSSYRAYAGQLTGGTLEVGDPVMILPSGQRSVVREIRLGERSPTQAHPPQSVSIALTDDRDVSRGDVLVGPGPSPKVTSELEAMICWMQHDRLEPRSRYVIKHTTRQAQALVTELVCRVDIGTLREQPGPSHLALNDLGRVRLRTSAPLVHEPYSKNRRLGSFILIDPATNATAGAGMILGDNHD